MTVGECTEARDPLKRVQHLTAGEGCSGNDKRNNNEYVILNKWLINNTFGAGEQDNGIPLTWRAGDGRSDVTRVWLKWYRAKENTSSEEPEEKQMY